MSSSGLAADSPDEERTREFQLFLHPDGSPKILPEGVAVAWRMCAYALVQREDGRILFVLPTYRDRLELPGGGVKLLESIEVGLCREVFEETGFVVRQTSPQPVYVGESNLYLPWKGGYFHAVHHVYACRIEEGQNPFSAQRYSDTDEIRAVRWVRLSELVRDDIHPIHHPIFELLGGLY